VSGRQRGVKERRQGGKRCSTKKQPNEKLIVATFSSVARKKKAGGGERGRKADNKNEDAAESLHSRKREKIPKCVSRHSKMGGRAHAKKVVQGNKKKIIIGRQKYGRELHGQAQPSEFV